ncbi:MAG: LysR family transcriptional regulator [Proteobacteria bacterium]|nr:LysR family transcriptional regulator [Pseudomonadota bacterium]
MLTLRQIEVIRAIMVTGTIVGAARLLNVSAPGISRLMKYTEQAVGLRLFDRRGGRYTPAPVANAIFEQINATFKKVEDLQYTIANVKRGRSQWLRIGSVPSIANVMVPRAIQQVRRKYASLLVDVNILKIEEAIDYLLLDKGDVVAVSSRFDHPSVVLEPLATGELFCIVPPDHALARRRSISAAEIVRHPLIGIDPSDPYGAIMAEIFKRQHLAYEISIKARFGTTVCALVKAGLGIAVIDQFTIAHETVPGVKVLRIEEPTNFQTYVAMKSGRAPSAFEHSFIELLRGEMHDVVRPPKLSPDDRVPRAGRS